MPSGPKKRKAMRKETVSVSPPHQNWFWSHMQMLKAPPLANGTKSKEKHYIAEKEAEGTRNWKEEEEDNISFICEGDEGVATGKMDALENEGSLVSSISKPEADNSQHVDDLKMLPLYKSKGELQETQNLEECSISKGSPEHSVTDDLKFDSCSGLEEKASEVKGTNEVEVDISFEEVKSLQEEAHVSVIEVVETEQAVIDKPVTAPVIEGDTLAHENENKLTVEAGGSIESHQNNETDAVTPKTEIPHPPIVFRRVSVWNCCGLAEVFTSFQH